MNINESAVLKTSKEIEISAPLETVWKIQTDINSWPSWQPEISKAKLMGPLEPDSTFVWKSAGFKLNSTIRKVSENSFIGWSGKGFGASAIHTWEFIALENGNTMVRTFESMDGWLVKLLKGMMAKKLHESLDVWLNALKRASEAQ
ncbi:SRPBCC family protein [Hydrogenovibrio sp. SC-1]|uniref:SRPBCC family protein n=1 Tax=Hydrogenovibrio sp. SC-1 TaxID=2065820 RepID=UPI0013045605|nr:SRPBCC family protein [Hydrogenovibrio sp. SC-1]